MFCGRMARTRFAWDLPGTGSSTIAGIPISENVVWTFTSFANLLAGNASVASGVIPAPGNTAHRDYFQTDFNPYIQDDWKVTSKLTVNLGLRWEFYSNPTERHDLLYTITNYATATGFTQVPNVFKTNPSLGDIDPRDRHRLRSFCRS